MTLKAVFLKNLSTYDAVPDPLKAFAGETEFNQGIKGLTITWPIGGPATQEVDVPLMTLTKALKYKKGTLESFEHNQLTELITHAIKDMYDKIMESAPDVNKPMKVKFETGGLVMDDKPVEGFVGVDMAAVESKVAANMQKMTEEQANSVLYGNPNPLEDPVNPVDLEQVDPPKEANPHNIEEVWFDQYKKYKANHIGEAKVALKDATQLYQPVGGSSPSSVYITVGIRQDHMKLAVRVKPDSISFRLEADKHLIPFNEWKMLNLKKAGGGKHYSVHFAAPTEVKQRAAYGAFMAMVAPYFQYTARNYFGQTKGYAL